MKRPEWLLKYPAVGAGGILVQAFHRFLMNISEDLGASQDRLTALENRRDGATAHMPNVAGLVDIPHGLGATPTPAKCSAQAIGTTFVQVQLVSVNGTNLRVILLDASGTPITSGSFTIRWGVAA